MQVNLSTEVQSFILLTHVYDLQGSLLTLQACKDAIMLRSGCPQAGETPAEAAARNVLRELKIDISPDRFKYLCHASLLWQFRHQEPKGDS